MLANKLLGDILYYCTVLSFIITVYKLGVIKEWKKYYSTILFLDLASLIYEFIFLYNYPLWEYGAKSPFGHTIPKFINMAITYPCSVMLFLHYYPKQKQIYRHAIYIFKWVCLYVIIEFIFYTLGTFRYYNGWNIGWSIIFCLFMFPLIKLHDNHPIWAWTASLSVLLIMMLILKFPFNALP